MRIALDYDNTFTADPEMWVAIVKIMQMRGHEVVIVTMRHEHEPVPARPKGVMVYYTGRKAKKPWMDSRRVEVNIWIDDEPSWLLHDSA